MLKVYTSTHEVIIIFTGIWYSSSLFSLLCTVGEGRNLMTQTFLVKLCYSKKAATQPLKKVISFLISFFHRFQPFNCRLSIVL